LADSSHPTLKRSSLNGGNLATPTRDNDAMSMSSFTDSEACCGGCRKLIDQENGGIVVAFGCVQRQATMTNYNC
jgi:hypothetical protein